MLYIKQGKYADFEYAFERAQGLISSRTGYISHQMQRCLETPGKYILLVCWRCLEDHTEGFRKSKEYQEWKQCLHHFYEPFPLVEHYSTVFEGGIK